MCSLLPMPGPIGMHLTIHPHRWGNPFSCVPARSGWSPNPRWHSTPWACSRCASILSCPCGVVGVHPRIGCPCAWGLPLFLGGIHLFGWSINGWRPAWMESNLWWAANLAPQLQPSDDLAWLWSAPPTSSLVGSLVSSASIRVGTRRARGLGARWV